MDIISYASNVKSFSENEIIAQLLTIEVSATDLDSNLENLKQSGVDLSEVINSWHITSGNIKATEAAGFRDVDTIAITRFGLATIKQLVPALTKEVKDYREKVWDGKLITLRQVNILNLIEYLGYWVKYSRKVFDVLLTMHNENQQPERYMVKADTRWINGTNPFYRSFTLDLLKGSRYIIENLKKIPDVEVDQTSIEVLEATEGKDKVDLLKQGFGVHLVNPVFWFALGKSKIQMMRIENMRRDNELFAMKISQAINKRGGSEDPQLDRQIEMYQEKIIKNEAAIEQIEAQYA